MIVLLTYIVLSDSFQTYRFISKTAGRLCNKNRPRDIIPCNKQYNHKILIGAMFAYEADTLQVALAEYDGVADILITENRAIHNFRERKNRKPFLLWPILKHKKEFQTNNSKILFKECLRIRNSNDMWEAESLDNKCMNRAILEYGKYYDVVIVGSTDEILARKTLLKLKYCKLPKLPASGAIGMPLGKLGRSFRTDWPVPGNRNALSLPSIYGKEDVIKGVAKRHIPYLGTTVMGGLHMTNYCFLPAMVLKEMWATEYGHKKINVCGSINKIKESCYNIINSKRVGHRVSKGTGPETIVPWLLEMCPKSFPSWYGNIDDREYLYQYLNNC